MAKNRSRRLRKKLRVDEFQELGFHIGIQASDDAEMQALVDRWLIEAMGNNGMAFGGGCDMHKATIEGFVTKRGRGTLTEEHRTIVKEWLESHPEIKEFETGPLRDAWHGWDE